MILVLTIIVSGIGAYFTGADRADDSYTIGKIEIALNGSDDLNKVEDLVPWDEYSFVRNVENTGINDAFVFMSVTIPYDAANLHDADGNTIYENESIQLFRYGTNGNAGVASQWKLVDAGKFADLDIQDMSATGIIEVSDTHGAVDTDDMSVTYVYGYVGDNADGSLKALAAGEITEDICDTMKFANVTDWNMEEKEGIILTRAYGIQTLNVLETNPLTGDNADGSVDVNAVWSVINNSRVGVTEPVPLQMVEKKIIIRDRNGNAVSHAHYELGGISADGQYLDIIGFTDENGEAIEEFALNSEWSSCYISTSKEGGNGLSPDDYLYNGGMTITEDTPYELVFPDILTDVHFWEDVNLGN